MLATLSTNVCRCRLFRYRKELIILNRTFRTIPSTRQKSPYEVLGIPRTATKDEIKTAYMDRIRQYHPDNDPTDTTLHTKFVAVQDAYDLLQSIPTSERGNIETAGVYKKPPVGTTGFNSAEWYHEHYAKEELRLSDEKQRQMEVELELERERERQEEYWNGQREAVRRRMIESQPTANIPIPLGIAAISGFILVCFGSVYLRDVLESKDET